MVERAGRQWPFVEFCVVRGLNRKIVSGGDWSWLGQASRRCRILDGWFPQVPALCFLQSPTLQLRRLQAERIKPNSGAMSGFAHIDACQRRLQMCPQKPMKTEPRGISRTGHSMVLASMLIRTSTGLLSFRPQASAGLSVGRFKFEDASEHDG